MRFHNLFCGALRQSRKMVRCLARSPVFFGSLLCSGPRCLGCMATSAVCLQVCMHSGMHGCVGTGRAVRLHTRTRACRYPCFVGFRDCDADPSRTPHGRGPLVLGSACSGRVCMLTFHSVCSYASRFTSLCSYASMYACRRACMDASRFSPMAHMAASHSV